MTKRTKKVAIDQKLIHKCQSNRPLRYMDYVIKPTFSVLLDSIKYSCCVCVCAWVEKAEKSMFFIACEHLILIFCSIQCVAIIMKLNFNYYFATVFWLFCIRLILLSRYLISSLTLSLENLLQINYLLNLICLRTIEIAIIILFKKLRRAS